MTENRVWREKMEANESIWNGVDKIQVIVSDIDGTLLGTDQSMASETMAAIQSACKAGIKIFLATSRSYTGIDDRLRNSGLISGYVLNGGAEVRFADGSVGKQIPIAPSICRIMGKKIGKYQIKTIVSTDERDCCLTSVIDADRKLLEKKQIYKMVLLSEDMSILAQIRKDLGNIYGIAITSSYKNNLEITDIRAQKGLVLKKYLTELGYKMEEIMVIGDSLNDHSMLSMNFGITVAMGNGNPEIRKIAKYVTKTNDELGVAFAIGKVLKSRKSRGQ